MCGKTEETKRCGKVVVSERSVYIRKYSRGLLYYARKQSINILYENLEDYLFYPEEVEVTERKLVFV